MSFDPVLQPDPPSHEPQSSALGSTSKSRSSAGRSILRLTTPTHASGIALLVKCEPDAHAAAASASPIAVPPLTVLVASARVLRGTSHSWLESVCFEALSIGETPCADGNGGRIWKRLPLMSAATGGGARLGFCWTSPDSELGATVLELRGAPASNGLLFVPIARPNCSQTPVLVPTAQYCTVLYNPFPLVQ